MSIHGHPAPLALPAAVAVGIAVAFAAFIGGEGLHLDDTPLVAIPIALGLSAGALTRRAVHRRAFERAARDHNAEN